MKAVLISIQPKWCELIASGKKTVEVRKTMPKLETPFKCYIYQTKLKWVFSFLRMWGMDNLADKLTAAFGKVVGEFVCDDCSLLTKAHYAYIEKHGYIPRKELKAYMGIENGRELSYSDGCYGWHISNLVIYDEPKPLSEFYRCGAVPMKDLDEELCSHCAATDYGEERECHTPDGTWMCDGRWCDEAYQAYLDEEFSLTRAPQSWCYVEG